MLNALLQILLNWLSSPTAMSILAGVVVWLLRVILKDRWDKVEGVLERGVGAAADLVGEIASKTPMKFDDQIALFLKTFKDYLAAHGHDPSPEQLDRAAAVFKAMKGQA